MTGTTDPITETEDARLRVLPADLEAARILLDAWKFRQGHIWKSLQTYWFAASIISIAPYFLTTNQVQQFGSKLLILPVLGMLLGMAAVWLYAAEYVRCQTFNTRFRKILELHDYYDVEQWPTWARMLRVDWSIGPTTVGLLVVMSVVLPLVNLWFVHDLILSALPSMNVNILRQFV